MTPPTVDEVRAYIIEKGFLTVDAVEFVETNDAGDWQDKKGHAYRNWKKVVVTWHYNALRWGQKPNICRRCTKYGTHRGHDDAGQQYWLCEDHKPRPRATLPDELTNNVLKEGRTIPIDVNNERNRQMKDLRA